MVSAALRVQHGPMGSPCHSSATRPHGRAELRTLIELAALRELADRGLTDAELSVSRRLARATVRSARRGDLAGYLESDAAFHLHLLGLAGDPVRTEVGRLLLGTRAAPWPAGGDPAQRMDTAAGEHGEIVALLADDMIGAASELLRHHVAGDFPGPGEP
jgi:DNA-binding GntR family transcriptional regulator